MTHLLERKFPSDCKFKKKLAWGMANFNYRNNDVKFDAFDTAHATPKELEYYVHHRAGAGSLKDWNFTDPIDGRPLSPGDVINEFESFTLVRNPYLRVLGAFDQRSEGMNLNRWGPFPDDFVTAMHYIEDGMKNRTLHWMGSPTITHFRPASLYTHWENNLPALRHVFKLEDLEPGLSEFLKKIFNLTEAPKMIMDNTKDESKNRKGLCNNPLGCVGKDDLDALLTQTAHTMESLEIVNRLYRRDFELLGYNMLTLPGGGSGNDHVMNRPSHPQRTFLTTTELWTNLRSNDNLVVGDRAVFNEEEDNSAIMMKVTQSIQTHVAIGCAVLAVAFLIFIRKEGGSGAEVSARKDIISTSTSYLDKLWVDVLYDALLI